MYNFCFQEWAAWIVGRYQVCPLLEHHAIAGSDVAVLSNGELYENLHAVSLWWFIDREDSCPVYVWQVGDSGILQHRLTNRSIVEVSGAVRGRGLGAFTKEEFLHFGLDSDHFFCSDSLLEYGSVSKRTWS
jgi:hypothetical protein